MKTSPAHKTWPRWRRHATLALGAAALVACGGGNQVDEPASFKLLPDDLVGAPCASCRNSYLVGSASDGAPLADAEVLLIDAEGRTASARTDALGRYAVESSALKGPLLVQLSGHSNGEPVLLHSLALAVDTSNRAVNINPLTELISAFVLGGAPQDLLQQGRLDFMRVNATSLRSNQDRVKNLVAPALGLAQAQALELRSGDFATRSSALDALEALLGVLEVQRQAAGYSLRAINSSGAAQAGVLVDAVASSTDAVLAPFSPAQTSAAQAGLNALPEIAAQLRQLTALFANRLPQASELRPWLADGFRHTGLDAAAFTAQVLLREEAPEQGGVSLLGAQFDNPRLLQVESPDRLLVRLQVKPAASARRYSETLWMIKVGGRWQWQGDGQAAWVRLRHLAVLGAKPRERAELLALPGMSCSAATSNAEPHCRIEGGQGDVAAGGVLEFGNPEAEQFGLLAHYRSDAPTWQARLNASRSLTRLNAAPSARVSNHLAFEVDRRRLDPRVQRVRVSGPGLPAQGLDLVAPNGDGQFQFLALSERPDQDWHAVRVGRCTGPAGAELKACEAAWAGLHIGSRYSFSFLDQQGGVIHTQAERLASQALPEDELLSRKAEFFARFDLQGAPAQQPLYERVLLNPLDPAVQAQAFSYHWAWQRPSGARQQLLGGVTELQLADPSSGEQSLRVQRLPASALLRADGSSVWAASAPLPAGWLPIWLTARLSTVDAMGNLYMHYIAPNNPY